MIIGQIKFSNSKTMAIKKKPELTWQQKLCKKFGITEQIGNGIGLIQKQKLGMDGRIGQLLVLKLVALLKRDVLVGPKFKIGYKATTLADAKKMAETFSDYVS